MHAGAAAGGVTRVSAPAVTATNAKKGKIVFATITFISNSIVLIRLLSKSSATGSAGLSHLSLGEVSELQGGKRTSQRAQDPNPVFVTSGRAEQLAGSMPRCKCSRRNMPEEWTSPESAS